MDAVVWVVTHAELVGTATLTIIMYAENRQVTEPEDYLDTTAKAKYEAARSIEEKKELPLAELIHKTRKV